MATSITSGVVFTSVRNAPPKEIFSEVYNAGVEQKSSDSDRPDSPCPCFMGTISAELVIMVVVENTNISESDLLTLSILSKTSWMGLKDILKKRKDAKIAHRKSLLTKHLIVRQKQITISKYELHATVWISPTTLMAISLLRDRNILTMFHAYPGGYVTSAYNDNIRLGGTRSDLVYTIDPIFLILHENTFDACHVSIQNNYWSPRYYYN